MKSLQKQGIPGQFKEKQNNDKNTLHLPRQYLPQSYGRVCNEGYGEICRAGSRVRDRFGGDKPGGDRQSGVSSGEEEAGGAWNPL